MIGWDLNLRPILIETNILMVTSKAIVAYFNGESPRSRGQVVWAFASRAKDTEFNPSSYQICFSLGGTRWLGNNEGRGPLLWLSWVLTLWDNSSTSKASIYTYRNLT